MLGQNGQNFLPLRFRQGFCINLISGRHETGDIA